MKRQSDADKIDRVPDLIEEWHSRGKWPAALQARSILLDASEELMAVANRESRALTAVERNAFDGHADQIREINESLAQYKRARVADLAAEGHPADHCRLPF
jgi:hypothetical protein